MKKLLLASMLGAMSLAAPAAAQAPRDNPPPSVENARKERALRDLIARGGASRETYLELVRVDTALGRYADAVSVLADLADLERGVPETQHLVATICWQYANREVQEPTARLLFIREGLALETRALQARPDYRDALIYKQILLRMQAAASTDPGEQSRLLAEADAIRARVLEQERQDGPDPAPPKASFGETMEQTYARLVPLRVGGNITPPSKVRDVRPVYPVEAQGARVQGVVIIEAVIDPSGSIANARVLRSIPLLDEAALGAVSRWQFTPTLVNGQPVAVLMTVTVNFTLQ